MPARFLVCTLEEKNLRYHLPVTRTRFKSYVK